MALKLNLFCRSIQYEQNLDLYTDYIDVSKSYEVCSDTLMKMLEKTLP
jgi:hypothetical protein